MESESTEGILMSLALKNACQLLQRPKTVLNSSSGFLLSVSAPKSLSKDVDVAVAEKVTDHPQRQRPAMGRKRAQFSFKPNLSQAIPEVGLSLDIDHLQDPDDFFEAFERLENAERELKKSRGDSLEDSVQRSQSMLAKRHRPGILGKTVNYRHLYPMLSGEENTVPLQGNKVEPKVLSPSMPLLEMRSSISQHPELIAQLGESCDRETTDGKLVAVTQGSVAGMENDANMLLNELLSNYKDLNMEETIMLLQDCLHVKPVVLEDIHIPELDDVQINDLEASQEPLLRPRKALADLQQVINITSNGKNRQENETVTFLQRLPTLPMGPFAPLFLLQKHTLQDDRLGDSPSGHLDAHVSHHEHSSTSKRTDKCAILPVVDTDLPDTISLSPFGDPTHELESLCMDGQLQPSIAELNTAGSNLGVQEVATKDMTSQFNEPIGSKSSEFVDDMATGSDGLDITYDDKVEDMLPATSVSEEPMQEGLTIGTVHSTEDPTETCLPIDRHSLNSSILQEEFNEGPLSHSASESNIKLKDKVPLRKQSKRDAPLLRQSLSLAGAGTKLESGLRRSTRIKSRPLQYWRGERFLYGRIHDSLPTVIGMKYASVANGCKEPVLKAKSYVSDDYAELVEIASLH